MKLYTAFEKVNHGAIETLITDLMARGESRGLAGVVHEEWVNSRATDKHQGGKLYFTCALLPVTSQINIADCYAYDFATENLHAICFKTFDDLTTQLGDLKDSTVGNGLGFDAILLFKSKVDKLVLAGIQYTSAAKGHPVSERGVIALAECAETVDASPELWFTQPFQCMEAGASLLVKIQPLKFSPPKQPLMRSPAKVKKSGAAKTAKNSVKNPRRGKGSLVRILKSSNKEELWNSKVRKVKQFVVVTSLASNTNVATGTTPIQETLRTTLMDATQDPCVVDSMDTSDVEGAGFVRPCNETVARALSDLQIAGVLKPFLLEFLKEAEAEMDVEKEEESEISDGAAAETDVEKEGTGNLLCWNKAKRLRGLQ